MPRNYKPRTSRSYPVEFLSIWQLAAAGKLFLTFPSRGIAVNKKQQLQAFRKRLLEEEPVVAMPFFQVDLLIEPAAGTDEVILRSYIPAWKQQVHKALVEADFSLPSPTTTIADANACADTESKEALDSTLANLGFKSGE